MILTSSYKLMRLKQLISLFLLSMFLSQSVLAGIIVSNELNLNSLLQVKHHFDSDSIEHRCTYHKKLPSDDNQAMIDSETNTHECHHHTTLLFIFRDVRLNVSFNRNKETFINRSSFISNILEPPFKPPIFL